MKLYIKNMVCNRCKTAVQNEIEKFSDVRLTHLELGEASISGELNATQIKTLRTNLEKLGFELMDDQKQQIIERIKTTIIETIHYNSDKPDLENLSDLLSRRLQRDYSALSKLFSEVEGITIEHFQILQKIERVKELLVYDELSLSEIAFDLNYSSVAHLSNQFKKITGLTPTHFKKIKAQKRKALDEVATHD